MMSIQERYSLFIKWGMLLFSLSVIVLPVSAGDFIVDIQPKSHPRCVWQGVVTINLTINGNPNDFEKQWYVKSNPNSDWKIIDPPLGTGMSYTPLSTSTATYKCIVTERSSGKTDESEEVILTFDDVPLISGITVSSVCEGEELVASVVKIDSRGRDLMSYEWKLKGVPIDGNTITDNKVPKLSYIVDATQNNDFLSITVVNGCGTATYPSADDFPKAITVHSLPQPPKPVLKDYCKGEKAIPLYIEGGSVEGVTEEVWFNEDGIIIPPPLPNTDLVGFQQWWVLQKVTHKDNISNPTCTSERSKAMVQIFSIPDPPGRDTLVTMCVNDPGITLKAQGTYSVKWYNDLKSPLSAAPQINTSKIEKQVYYVSQNNGRCESPIDKGKITVDIRGRANADNIRLKYNPELCPNTSTIILAEASVSGPVFKWYLSSNKTLPVNTVPGNGSIFETPVLKRDTAYYVSIVHGGLCESSYTQAVVLNVRDITPPKITAPSSVVISTDHGVCHATSVDVGFPLVADNCTPANKLIVTSNPSVSLTTRYELGDTTLIWWVTDEAGNADYALQNVSVRDKQKPWPVVPVHDIIKDIDENENSAVVFYDWKYEDNCTPVSELKDSLYKGLPSGSVFPLGTTQIIRYIIDKAGNVDTCRFKVIVQHPYRPMEVFLRWNRNPVCPGQEVSITAVVNGGSGRATFAWNRRSWTDQVMKDYPLEDYTYEVVVNDGITTVTKSLAVTVLKTQPVELALKTIDKYPISMDDIFEGDELLVEATSGFDSYKLLFNNKIIQEVGKNNYVTFQAGLGTYVVRVFATDTNFCVSQDQMIIEVESRKLPNVFTPESDEYGNAVFLKFFETPKNPTDFELQIFSRAGQLLYKGNQGWDGKYKGKVMPQGTYLYVLRRKMNSGEFRVFKGNVTLKLLQ